MWKMQKKASFQFYVVFHKQLYRDCYSGIPEEEFRKYITCMAVNKNIEKTYDPWFEPSVMREYELPWNTPVYQNSRFCESSVYLHLYENFNTLVDKYDFIGCLHYDMRIKSAMFDKIKEHINDHQDNDLMFYFDVKWGFLQFGTSSYNDKLQKEELLVHNGWMTVLNEYNKFFKTSHEYRVIVYEHMPLFHTFMMHKSVFARIVPFIKGIIPLIIQFLHGNTRHLPYALETLWGMMLMLNKRENPNMKWVKLHGIIHDENIKDNWKPNDATSKP